jgi:hypothetical protein
MSPYAGISLDVDSVLADTIRLWLRLWGREVRAEAGFIERLVGINDPKDTMDSISHNSEIAGQRVVKAIKAGETL